MTENEMLKIAVHCLGVQAEQEVCEECDIYGNCHTDCKDVAVVAIKALEEIQQYRAIGTVEECRKAVENKKKYEKQWHNDMENPLEPIKVYSALKSEILKLELQIKNRPKDISILDYTVIAALQKVLKNNLEGMEDE